MRYYFGAFVVLCALSFQFLFNTMSKEVKAANLLLRLEGKRAVVVGGTSGIGRGIAERLAKAGSDVTIVGRESRRSQEVMAGLEPRNDEQKFAFVKCNCFLLSEVNKCVEKLLDSSEERGIDYLVMTHGMATIQGFTPSEEEGLDQKLALHVYSRAAFAKGLLPALEKSDDPRILSVLSAGIHSAYIGYKTDPELCNGGYSIKNAADAGGFYNDIFLDSLSRENSNVAFFHAAPGFVNTSTLNFTLLFLFIAQRPELTISTSF